MTQAPVAIAFSGGIDSLTAAFLLQKKGLSVLGLYFFTGYEDPSIPVTYSEKMGANFPLYQIAKSHPIAVAAHQIDLPLWAVDFRDVFYTHVVSYFISSYQTGITPNPCLMCNPMIKFGALQKIAFHLGATSLATGHYVNRVETPDRHVHLYKGKDKTKDQSYFLGFLSEEQLQKALFPLGNFMKKEVLELASKNNLIPAHRSESQDICFISKDGYKNFLEKQPDFHTHPGSICTTSGKKIGAHQGLYKYTIGQRKGIDLPAAMPYYVTDICSDTNSLVVGMKKELDVDKVYLRDIHWIHSPCKKKPLWIKLRYHHVPCPVTLTQISSNTAIGIFDTPQQAVTPGQGAVFYQKDEVIGAGWIASRNKEYA